MRPKYFKLVEEVTKRFEDDKGNAFNVIHNDETGNDFDENITWNIYVDGA